MKFTAGNVFIRLGKHFNHNVVQFLNKERFSQSCNIINIQKRYKTQISKPNLFVGQNKNKDYVQVNKIGTYGYFLLSVPIITFILGTWQVKRLKWKTNLLECLNERTKCKPIELPTDLEELKSKEFYPIKVKGTFINEKEFIIGFRNLVIDDNVESKNTLIGNKKDEVGYHVITPFKLSNQDLTILVNRGWIPKKHVALLEKHKGQIEDEVEITGIIRLNEKRPPLIPKHNTKDNIWYYRDVDAMAKKADTAPIYIEMVYNKDAPTFPVGGQTTMKIRNEHLSYIITWYSLSALTGYMWYKQIYKKVPIMF